MPTLPARPRAVATALLVVMLMVGCAGPPPPAVAESSGVRTDHQPLADRFPRLGTFVETHWVGGRLGDDRVPGPSTYFIEAAVTLAPAEMERLAGQYPLSPAPASPQPPAELAAFVPGAATWSTSPALEQGFGPLGWGATVYLQRDSGLVYVSARGN